MKQAEVSYFHCDAIVGVTFRSMTKLLPFANLFSLPSHLFLGLCLLQIISSPSVSSRLHYLQNYKCSFVMVVLLDTFTPGDLQVKASGSISANDDRK